MERNNQNYYFHQDGLGSIIAITDASGQKVQSYSYDSFGNITAQQNTTFIQPFAYTGRIWDAEIGLYDYRLRTYDPVLGKFIQKDPLSFAAGDTNLYRYVQNNPVNYIDPSGLEGTLAATLWGWVGTGTRVAAGGATATVGVTGGIVTGIIFGMPSSMAGGEYDYLVFRTNPNVKGSTPNYKKPKGGSKQCSYKGPPPDDFDKLYWAMMAAAGSPVGQKILNELPEFLGAQIPDPAQAPPSQVSPGSALGYFFNRALGLLP